MKKLITILAICLGCSMALSAQNIWKPIGAPGYVLAVAPTATCTRLPLKWVVSVAQRMKA